MKRLLIALWLTAAFAQAATPELQAVVRVLGQSSEPAAQLNILRGVNTALKGKRNIAPPAEWGTVYEALRKSPNAEVRQQAQALAVTFGATGAIGELRKVLADQAAPMDRRRGALDSLVSAKDSATLPLLLAEVAKTSPLRAPALRALAQYDAETIPAAILAAYPKLGSDEKRDALATLTMRAAWAGTLLQAIDEKKVARTDISAPLARQLQDLHDPAVDQWLAKNWGAVRTSSAEKQKEMARFKAFLTPAFMAKADPSRGRAIFAQTCAICHTLFGVGAKIGPELPGAFEDVDYLLQNIIDPNAIIGKDYQQTVVQMKDGQTVIGIVASDEGGTLTLKSLAGPITIQRLEIASAKVLEISLMPEGLLAARDEGEVRDLFAYLGRHGQVPTLVTEANATDFFNGADLSRWIPSSAAAWKLEHGEVLGTASGAHPEFLRSDMLMRNAKFTCSLTVRGGSASLLLADREAAQERPVELPSSEAPIAVEVLHLNGVTTVSLDGRRVELPPGQGEQFGVGIGFAVPKAGTALTIRQPKLELLPGLAK